MEPLCGKHITVAGLGYFGGNVAAARWLVEQGAIVLVTDRSSAEKLASSVAQLAGLPIQFRLGEHRVEDFTSADLVVTTPAIPPDNEFLIVARAAGIPITTEIRLFIERCPATIVGVTGSKGKSTTAAMLHHILAEPFNAHFGGNIGRSLLPELATIGKTDLVVLELSSFMLEYLREMKWSPHIGLITMLAPDHLDWHGDESRYFDAKANILRFQRPDDLAVINEECPRAREIAERFAGRKVYFGIGDRPLFDLKIPGRHNQLNAQGAFAAAQALGITWEQAQQALADFKGLPHRLQLVHESNGIRYYNDSIATIPQAAIAALESFPPKKVIQIVGGSDKGLPLTDLSAALVERAKAVLCIGDLGPRIGELIAQAVSNTAAPSYQCHDLPTAMKLAKQIAAPGDIVLLSPGCASYDQFRNFQSRGEQFAELAKGNL